MPAVVGGDVRVVAGVEGRAARHLERVVQPGDVDTAAAHVGARRTLHGRADLSVVVDGQPQAPLPVVVALGRTPRSDTHAALLPRPVTDGPCPRLPVRA